MWNIQQECNTVSISAPHTTRQIYSKRTSIKDVYWRYTRTPHYMTGPQGKAWDKGKGKAVPLHAWSGPEGSRKLAA